MYPRRGEGDVAKTFKATRGTPRGGHGGAPAFVAPKTRQKNKIRARRAKRVRANRKRYR